MRENNFDFLRLALASIVVVFHSSILSQSPGLAFLQQYFSATFAVQAFFAVSGFLIFMSYEREPSLLSYSEKRARRILPAYICVIIVSVLLGSILTTLPVSEYWRSTDLGRYLSFNLLFLNYKAPSLPGVFDGQYQQAVNGSLWTLKIELMFYAFVPVLHRLTRSLPAYAIFIFIYIASVAWSVGLLYFSDGSGIDLYARLAKQLPGQLSYFIAGSALYQWWKEGRKIHWSLFLLCCFAYRLIDGYALELLGPALVAVISIYIALYFRFLGNAARYGDFSYGIYIYHFPVVQTFVALGFFSMSPWWSLIGVILVVALLAIFSWHLIESPVLSRTRSRRRRNLERAIER